MYPITQLFRISVNELKMEATIYINEKDSNSDFQGSVEAAESTDGNISPRLDASHRA